MNKSSLHFVYALLGGAASLILLLLVAQATAGAGTGAGITSAVPATSAGVPAWGSDLQVNPTPTDNPYHPMQLDFSMATNPNNPDNIIAGWESLQSAPSLDAYGWSTDQGQTWATGRFDGPWAPGKMTPLGTVTTAFDAHGTAYYAGEAQGSGSAGYFVLTTTNGVDWSTPVPMVTTDSNSPIAYNDGFLAADRRASGQYAGSLYGFWLYTDLNYPNLYHGIRERYSRDGGRTWSADVTVTNPNNDFVYYPVSIVAPDGSVYVAFEELDGYQISNAPKLYLARSTDGGQSWGTNQLITGAAITPIGRSDFEGRELTLVTMADCNHLIRINHYPAITVSPTDPNTVYVVWNDGRWQDRTDLCGSQGHHSDVAFSRTTDSGATWSAPVRINDDPQNNGVDHFQPNIALGPDGLLGVTWLDRRYDPDHYMYDLDYSQSTDGGLTWSANQRVSDTSNDPNQLQDYKLIDNAGYRRALVFGPDYALPSWVGAFPGILAGNFLVDHGVLATDTPTPAPTNSTSPTSVEHTSTPTPTGTSTASTPLTTSTSTSTSTPTLISTSISTYTATSTSLPVSTSTRTITPEPTATACTIQFADVPPGSTFYSFIRCLACKGIISGYPCGGPSEICDPSGNPYFRPGNNVTRGQAAKIISNSANYQDVIPANRQTFNDVPPGSTFWLYVERVALHGAIHGYPCGGAGEPCPGAYFRPGNNLTRGQMAQIDSTVAGYQDVIPANRQTFNDVPPGSTFWLYVERVYRHGIINGYPCGGAGEPCPGAYYRPNNNVTRGQTSKIATNTFFPDCNPALGH